MYKHKYNTINASPFECLSFLAPLYDSMFLRLRLRVCSVRNSYKHFCFQRCSDDTSFELVPCVLLSTLYSSSLPTPDDANMAEQQKKTLNQEVTLKHLEPKGT